MAQLPYADGLTPTGAVPPQEAVVFDMDGVVADAHSEHVVRAFATTVDIVRRLRAGGVRVALVSESRSVNALLASADVAGVFELVLDGRDVAELGRQGKPDPATLLEAARRLGVAPARTAVVADTTLGIEAACRGGFGLVVGVAGSGLREALEAAGAHLVVGGCLST
jgi:beta-phosphoglucomutase-like phosphatase (HAD superfamily)